MQTRIDHQKYVADTVLSKLELLDRYCIVAGGAPRDWYLGKEATDIDVYLHYPQPTNVAQRLGLLNSLGFQVDSHREDWQVKEVYEMNQHIKQLYNTQFLDEKIQIMFVNKPTFTSVVDTFPISISKAWYKKGKIGVTEDFENSVKYKILYKTVESYKESSRYLVKIREKFSDYKYITKEQVAAYRKLISLKKLVEATLSEVSLEDAKEFHDWLLNSLQEDK